MLPEKLVTSLDNGHWEFPEQLSVKNSGFVYVIFDTVLKRGYIGKKTFKSSSGVVSNWRSYVSSSKLLAEVLKDRPRGEFRFFVLEQYKTKGTLSYAETWSLCQVEAPTTVKWYNTRIEAVSWSVKEPITDRHKERLNVLKMEVL